MLKNILLVGATGAVGNLALRKICQNSDFLKIVLLTRKKIAIDDPRVIQIITDFKQINPIDIGPIDAGLCALGTTIKKAGSKEAFSAIDHELVIRVAKICKSLGAKNFGVVSALGASKESKIFYNKVKGEMEEDLAKINFLTLTILRPSLLLGERNEFRLGEKAVSILVPLINPLLRGNYIRYRAIPTMTVANHLYQSIFANESSIVENEKMLT